MLGSNQPGLDHTEQGAEKGREMVPQREVKVPVPEVLGKESAY